MDRRRRRFLTYQIIRRFYPHCIIPSDRPYRRKRLNSATEPHVKVIDFDRLKQNVLERKVSLIDVREPKELKDDGKIPNSVNIPLGQIAEAFELSESEFKEKFGMDKPAKSDEFVLYCRSGKRAMAAYDELVIRGYTNITLYLGSFTDWQKNGGPVEKRIMTESHLKVIDFDRLKQKVIEKKVTVIDVREPKELKDDGKIPNSVNIPLGQIAEAFKLSGSEFEEKFGIDKPAKSDEFVLSCTSGKRAMIAYDRLVILGYTNISIYLSSFTDWQTNGGLVEK